MPQPGRGPLAIAIIAAGLAVTLPPPASAHVPRTVGGFRLSIGWATEPVFAGSLNAVEVTASDAAGAPVRDAGGTLSAEVSFGDLRSSLPLLPAEGRPGEYRATLVPTRPGTYAFHIAGTLRGRAIDTAVTCSDSTFDCVTDSSAVQFPAKDPSTGQLADRIARALPRAERARSTAAQARLIAIGAAAAAALALAATIGRAVRRRRQGS